jgi:glycerophosphoryl diester phosphodiesterase
LTFEQTQQFSAGSRFSNAFRDSRLPTLDAGLSALGKTTGVYLDAKDIAPESLLAEIHKHRLEDRHVVYQSTAYCARLRKLDPRVRILPPLRSLEQLEDVAAVKPFGVDVRWSLLSQELIARCHQKGILVFSDALGFNESVDKYRAALRWGIDCIQTDHPLRVLRAIELMAARKPR